MTAALSRGVGMFTVFTREHPVKHGYLFDSSDVVWIMTICRRNYRC